MIDFASKGVADPGGVWDVVVVGAGPAGLSAALVLGRACRRVLVCDSRQPRNAASRAVHGFLTRDGTPPDELRRLGRDELRPYPSVVLRQDVEVTDVRLRPGGFDVLLDGDERVHTRRLLLATGLVDQLPPVDGMAELWGAGVFPCPYCDAYELRGKRVAVYGRGQHALELCRAMTGWTADVMLFTDGPPGLGPDQVFALESRGIPVVTADVRRLVGRAGGGLQTVDVDGRPPIARDALFLSFPQHQRSPLAAKLGCELTSNGAVQTGELESTNIPGLFVAGDASTGPRLAIVAAAEGAMAAFAINRSLVRDAFEEMAPATAGSRAPAEPARPGSDR